MLTSRDIAKKAGVSPSTVSRAFDPDSRISEKTREKILAISEQFGYAPNIAASSLKAKSSGIIGVVFTDATNIFLTNVLRDLEFCMDALGYRLIVMYSNQNPGREANHLQTLLSLRAEGVFLLPVISQDNTATKRVLSQYRALNIPVLQCFAHFYPELHTLAVNDRFGGFNAANALLQMGHRRILFADSMNNDIGEAKIRGYKEAFESFGAPCPEEFTVHLRSGADLKSRLKERIQVTDATALITSFAPVTISALRALKELGYNCPDDISIIAFDDNEWLSLLDITSLSVPDRTIGSTMTSLLLHEIRDAGYNEPYLLSELDPILIHRNSVKNLYTE